jgi:hypothetical protein
MPWFTRKYDAYPALYTRRLHDFASSRRNLRDPATCPPTSSSSPPVLRLKPRNPSPASFDAQTGKLHCTPHQAWPTPCQVWLTPILTRVPLQGPRCPQVLRAPAPGPPLTCTTPHWLGLPRCLGHPPVFLAAMQGVDRTLALYGPSRSLGPSWCLPSPPCRWQPCRIPLDRTLTPPSLSRSLSLSHHLPSPFAVGSHAASLHLLA